MVLFLPEAATGAPSEHARMTSNGGPGGRKGMTYSSGIAPSTFPAKMTSSRKAMLQSVYGLACQRSKHAGEEDENSRNQQACNP